MREILFRGFHKDENGKQKVFVNGEWINGEWVYGYPVIDTGDCSLKAEGKCFCPHDGTSIFFWDDDFHEYTDCAIVPETVGQYTGLTDKNGMKIFEGDIVRYSDVDTVLYFDEQNCFTGTIKFECGAFGIACNGYIPLHYPDACNNDNFVSLWEINWNEDEIEESLSNINIIGNVHDNPELLDGAGNG